MDQFFERHVSQQTQAIANQNRSITIKELNLEFFKLKKYTSMPSMPRYSTEGFYQMFQERLKPLLIQFLPENKRDISQFIS